MVNQNDRSRRRSLSADKTTNRASDDVIKSIIERIKTQVPESEQTSNRGAARKVRSHSEAGTECSPIVINTDSKRPTRSRSRTSSSGRGRSSSGHKLIVNLPTYHNSRSLPDNMDSSSREAASQDVSLANTENPGEFKCGVCEHRFPNEPALANHKKKCSDLYKHMCEECGKSFKAACALDAHLQWHKSMKVLTCKECHKVCKNTLLLKLHVEMHASGKFRFRCNSCSKSFFTKKKLEAHVRDHITQQKRSPKSPRKLKCQVCSEEFKEQAVYTEHLKTHSASTAKQTWMHPDAIAEKIYFDSASNVPISSASILDRLNTPPLQNVRESSSSPDVQIIEDPKGGQQKCLICNEVFDDMVKKMVHAAKHFKPHSDPDKVICQDCRMPIARDEMEQHESVHATAPATTKRQEMLECPVCNAPFDNNDDLNSHFVEEHGDEPVESVSLNQSAPPTPVTSEEENKCHKCFEKFPSQDELEQHLFTHYTTKGKGPLICPVCNRMFTNKYATYEFKRHMCSHTGEKPIPCRFCEKKFKDYSGRSQHEKRVHNRGPLNRGRRKGYKMDRDQLYTPPQPHHYLDDGHDQPTTNNPEIDFSSHGMIDVSDDKAPPPLLSLSSLPDNMKRKLVNGRREDDGSDSGEDFSLITAVKGAQVAGTSNTQDQVYKPPPLYRHHNLPVNVVRPAVSTNTSAAPMKNPFPVKPSQTSPNPNMPPGSMYIRPPTFADQHGISPLELLSNLSKSKGAVSQAPPNQDIMHKASLMAQQNLAPHVMVAQLSDSGIPLVTMDRAPVLLNGPLESPRMSVAAPMVMPTQPQMISGRDAGPPNLPPMLIPSMTGGPMGRPLDMASGLPYPGTTQPLPYRMGNLQMGNFAAQHRSVLDGMLEKREKSMAAVQQKSIGPMVSKMDT